ncbi:MAG: T9SS type A sorting domain-containing protein [Bacteroidota bacterium]
MNLKLTLILCAAIAPLACFSQQSRPPVTGSFPEEIRSLQNYGIGARPFRAAKGNNNAYAFSSVGSGVSTTLSNANPEPKAGRITTYTGDTSGRQWNIFQDVVFRYDAEGRVNTGIYIDFTSGDSISRSRSFYNAQGKDTLDIIEYHDAVNGWENEARSRTAYDDFGNIILSTYEDYTPGSGWNMVSGTRRDLTYEANRFKKLSTYTFFGNSWNLADTDSVTEWGANDEPLVVFNLNAGMPFRKTIYTAWHNWVSPRYLQALPTAYVVQIYENGAYTNFVNISSTYTVLGSLSTQVSQAWVNNAWQYHTRIQYSYSPGDQTDSVRYEHNDSPGPEVTWKQDAKYLYNRLYNPDNTLAELIITRQLTPGSAIKNLWRHIYADYTEPLGLPHSGAKTRSLAVANPFGNELCIPANVLGPYSITDLSGRVLIQGNLTAHSSGAGIQTSQLLPGIYLLKAAGRVQKVVKE